MSVKSFLKLVEIQTKVASVIPFLLGTSYALYRYNTFNVKNFIIMLGSLLCIDMATTAINNYLDYKRANKRHGYGYEKHNAIVLYHLKESTVVITIFILLILASAFGLLLYFSTNIVVLLLGIFSFAIGVLYSYGPIPISRTPLGEIFSGGVMGFIIPFLAVYIHIYNQDIVNITYSDGVLALQLSVRELAYIMLLSLPSVTGIANIMLANNICDIEDDIENSRYTLPIYVGRQKALTIFKVLYIIGFIAIIILLVYRAVPLSSILTLATFFVVYRHIGAFYEKQTKKDTFILSVKNFVLTNVVFIITIAIALLWK